MGIMLLSSSHALMYAYKWVLKNDDFSHDSLLGGADESGLFFPPFPQGLRHNMVMALF